MDKNRAVEDLKALQAYFQEQAGATPVCLEYAISALEEDKKPEGKWKRTYLTYITEDGLEQPYYRIVCSNCNQANAWGDVPYCPWCGTKMEPAGEVEFGEF